MRRSSLLPKDSFVTRIFWNSWASNTFGKPFQSSMQLPCGKSAECSGQPHGKNQDHLRG